MTTLNHANFDLSHVSRGGASGGANFLDTVYETLGLEMQKVHSTKIGALHHLTLAHANEAVAVSTPVVKSGPETYLG